MTNHKWKNEAESKYEKMESCTKCKVFRTWQGGDMQCWMYWYPREHDLAMIKKQFNRPECINKIINL